jgi:hypothetical protein
MVRAPSVASYSLCLAVLIATGQTNQQLTLAAPPYLLSQTGLYSNVTNFMVDTLNRHYSPQYPLWSDGAVKSRWFFLPSGKPIDIHEIDAWIYPVGTKFWKEFVFGGHKVETRLIWRAGTDRWVFATYAWLDDQSDAVLVPESGIRDAYEIMPGKMHTIPSIQDCKACHESRRIEILGFNTLQLSPDRDSNAPNAESIEPTMAILETLMDEGVFSPIRNDLVERPPRIATDNPRTRAALGYLSANCGGCHNPDNPLAYRGVNLKHPSNALTEAEEPGLQTTLNRTGRYVIPGIPPGETRLIRPGKPECSSILTRMLSRSPSSQMPPLGTVIVDQSAVELIKQWIASDLAMEP